MKALTVIPGQAGSARLDEVPEPPQSDGAILVQTHSIGVCGTDLEILDGHYGWAPPGDSRLIIGHESLGRVLEAPRGGAFAHGDWVVGIVRRPDPVPCSSCAVGEWDMCRNGRYTERGIKQRHGYASQRYRIEPEYLVKVDPRLGATGILLETSSVLAKAWEQIERIGNRTRWNPRRVLITGAGPVGLLAALMSRQRGFETHVFDRVKNGPKPELTMALGAAYHSDALSDACPEADIVLECTGAGRLVFEVMRGMASTGILCLTGVSAIGRKLEIDAGAVNRELVLENEVVFGSVNANRRHYEQAALALARAEHSWLTHLTPRKVPLSRWEEAYERHPGDVKTVLDFTDHHPSRSAFG